MKKQTAVEWLHYHLAYLMQTREWRSKDLHIEKFDELFIEALEMEKEQITHAYVYGSSYGIDLDKGLSPNNYFQETYKGGEQ